LFKGRICHPINLPWHQPGEPTEKNKFYGFLFPYLALVDNFYRLWSEISLGSLNLSESIYNQTLFGTSDNHNFTQVNVLSAIDGF